MGTPKKVLVLGPQPGDPAVAAVQAIRALRDEGACVVLLDPNAASVSTDPELAHRTYLEPVTREAAERVIALEQPDAVLATTSGDAGLQLALALARPGLTVLGAARADAPRLLAGAPGTLVEAIVLRDATDALLLCTFEHPDARGVHPADSIALCPAQLPPAQLGQVQSLAAEALARLGAFGGVVRLAVGDDVTVLEASACFTHECGLATHASGVAVAGVATRLALGRTLAGLGVAPLPVPGALVRLPVFEVGAEGLALGRARRSRGHVVGAAADRAAAMRNAWQALDASADALLPELPISEQNAKRVVLVGAGADAANEGPELDWACVHAGRALREAGFEPVLVSPNPDSLCGELGAVTAHHLVPLKAEAVLGVCRAVGASTALLQCGGRAALELAEALEAAGITLLGTGGGALAVMRDELPRILRGLGVAHAPGQGGGDATVVDLDLVADRTGKVVVGGVLQQVEPALVHPSDAAATFPPHSLRPEVIERLKDVAGELARALRVVGLLSVRFLVRGKAVSVVEAVPRVSRTLPVVAKATGVPMVRLAVRVALGDTLVGLGVESDPEPRFHAVKEAVLPVTTGAVRLGPRGRATGTVMSFAESLPAAFASSQLAAGTALPTHGRVLLALTQDDNPAGVDLHRRLVALGYEVLAAEGTQAYLAGKRIAALLAVAPSASQLALLIDTRADDHLRREAVMAGVPHFSTVEAARLLVSALEARASGERSLRPLQAFLEAR